MPTPLGALNERLLDGYSFLALLLPYFPSSAIPLGKYSFIFCEEQELTLYV